MMHQIAITAKMAYGDALRVRSAMCSISRNIISILAQRAYSVAGMACKPYVFLIFGGILVYSGVFGT